MHCQTFRPRYHTRLWIPFLLLTLTGLPAICAFAETGQSLVEKAQRLDKDGFFQEAVAAWEQLLQSNPSAETAALARLKLSSTYLKLGQPTKARATVKELTETSPDHFDAQFHLANTEAVMKNFPAAIQAYEKAVALRPDEGLGYVGLALCQFGNGNPDAAVENLQAAKKIFKKKKNIPWYRDARIAIQQIKGFAKYPKNFADLWLENNLVLVRNTYEKQVFPKE